MDGVDARLVRTWLGAAVCKKKLCLSSRARGGDEGRARRVGLAAFDEAAVNVERTSTRRPAEWPHPPRTHSGPASSTHPRKYG